MVQEEGCQIDYGNLMKRSRQVSWGLIFVSSCVFFFTIPLFALTIDQIIKLKEAGVDDRTIQMLIEQEKKGQEAKEGLGVKEVPRPEGGKDKIYYSTTTQEEDARVQQEEKQKLERAWEILRNIIIDERKR